MPRKRKSQREAPRERQVPDHVRERQRAVAEREAARLARPDVRPSAVLGHADRRKSAVTSTPFGVLSKRPNQEDNDKDEWCGPMSVARRMIAERDEERRRQEEERENREHHPLDEVMKEVEANQNRKKHPSLSWKSSLNLQASQKVSAYGKRQKRMNLLRKSRMPSLYQQCLDFVVTHFDHVESLGPMVDSSIRQDLVRALTGQRNLTAEALEVLAEDGVASLELDDASSITQEELIGVLRRILPKGLEYLALDQAGRCFGPRTVQALVEAKRKLRALSVGGAYLLKEQDMKELLAVIEPSSLQVKACPLFKMGFCESLCTLKEPLVELSLGEMELGSDGLDALEKSASVFGGLQSLSLTRLTGLQNHHVNTLLKVCHDNIKSLNLADNDELDDDVLDGVRLCAKLKSINLAGLRLLSSAGLEALLTPVPESAVFQGLSYCNFGRLIDTTVSDSVVELLVASNPQLRYLNVQGSTVLTDSSLEALVASCPFLETLEVNYCPNITDQGMGYLVDNSHLTKLEIWGCAQLTEVFMDGHRAELEIVGAWMRPNSLPVLQ